MLILMTRESCADANPTEKRGGERKYRPYQRHLCISSQEGLFLFSFSQGDRSSSTWRQPSPRWTYGVAIFKPLARIRRRRTPPRTLSHALFLLARSSHAAQAWSICNANEYSTPLRVCTRIGPPPSPPFPIAIVLKRRRRRNCEP